MTCRLRVKRFSKAAPRENELQGSNPALPVSDLDCTLDQTARNAATCSKAGRPPDLQASCLDRSDVFPCWLIRDESLSRTA